jgi:hypothetical protein
MNADAKLDALLWRQAGVALDHASLHLEGATDRVDRAPEHDDRAVAGALHNTPAMRRGEDCILARLRALRSDLIDPIISLASRLYPAMSDTGDRRELPGFAHCAPPAGGSVAQKVSNCSGATAGNRKGQYWALR